MAILQLILLVDDFDVDENSNRVIALLEYLNCSLITRTGSWLLTS